MVDKIRGRGRVMPERALVGILMVLLLAGLMSLGCQHAAPRPAAAPEQTKQAAKPPIPPLVAAPVNTEASDRTYRLGPDDRLSVVIRGKGGYSVSVDLTVQPQGTVVLPMLNEVSVAGLTLSEFTSKVERLLAKDYLVSPKVFATLKERRSHKVTLLGEVSNAGTYYLQAEFELLKDVIIRAGGPSGDFNKTIVLIRFPQAATQKDSQISSERVVVSLIDLMTKADPSLNVPVRSGDIIYVLSGEQAVQFAGSKNYVLVFGQVKNPGIVPYTKGLTVLRAILKAGNFLQTASRSRVYVKRTVGGKVVTIRVNVNQIIEAGDKSADIALQPGDVVYVPRSIF